MAVVLKEQLELRPSVALQKKVGLKSLEQVIRWGDRVNQELCRWRMGITPSIRVTVW